MFLCPLPYTLHLLPSTICLRPVPYLTSDQQPVTNNDLNDPNELNDLNDPNELNDLNDPNAHNELNELNRIHP